MRIAKSYEDARRLLRDVLPPAIVLAGNPPETVPIGIDIGRQFGTRIIITIKHHMAMRLLDELEKRDLPLPSVIYYNNRILIGVEPE